MYIAVFLTHLPTGPDTGRFPQGAEWLAIHGKDT